MKEWALKHPIMTFLLVDGLITGILKTVNAFAPKKTDSPAAEDGGEKNDAVEVTVEVPEIEVEVEDKEETK